jgi:hypothetical protein
MSETTPIPQYTKLRKLARAVLAWDDNDQIQEAHTTWRNTILEDGTPISHTDELAPLVVGDGHAENLEAVLGALNVSNIATIQQLQANLATSQGETAKAKADHEAENAAKDANIQNLMAQVEALKAQIAIPPSPAT